MMHVIYSKMTSERREKYRISTMLIKSEDKKRYVFKRAMNSKAKAHVQKIKENAVILTQIYGKEHVANCEYIKDGILSFEFVDGISLLEILQQALAKGNKREFFKWIKFYEHDILRGGRETSVQQIDINPQGRNQNLDLSFDNIIVTDNAGWKIIDYEWLTKGVSREYIYIRTILGALTRIGNNREQLLEWLLEIQPDFFEKIKSDKFRALNKTFLDEVLVFPHDHYKHSIYSIKDLLAQERQEVIKEKNELIYKLNEQITQLNKNYENKINTRDAEINSLNFYLNNIKSSRGYRLVQYYYQIRDKILPQGSVRRLLIKNLVWSILHPRKTVSLFTVENTQKIFEAWRLGGINQIASRIDHKIHSPAVQQIMTISNKNLDKHNLWIDTKQKKNIPENIVIDIIVPVYNALDFTKKCIERVLQNTDINYRLIVIDDCSPDPKVEEYFREIKKIQLSGHLKELLVLKNEKNLGFLGTVNRAFSIAQNHIVLLNTDTEVPPEWLSRLIWPFFDDKKVATVTPFSNSAEICSFPKFVQNNDLPKDLDVVEVDNLFKHYGEPTYIEIPTGVGFAMAVNYNCLQEIGGFDPIFDKGYCEENDFCRRAVAKGWKNVHIRDLFIYHKHGASFATRKDSSKNQRLAKNLAILNQRYPGYDHMIQEYISKDPCYSQRIFLNALARALQGHKIGKKGILFLNHSLGGGTQSYQNEQVKYRLTKERVYSATILADGYSFVVIEYKLQQNICEEEIARFDYSKMTEVEYQNLLRALFIDEIFINHLLGFKLPDFLLWNQNCGIPYTVFLHDFYFVCPHYTLINNKGRYCYAEKDVNVCMNCLRRGSLAKAVNIEEWRKEMEGFLAKAFVVKAPSQNTVDIVQSYYPKIKIEVREHKLSTSLHKTYRREFSQDKIKTIVVLGAIGFAKGVDIVYGLKDIIERQNAPIRLVVIGYTSKQNEAYVSPSKHFEITGPYNPDEISDLLAEKRASLVIIPSIWPETFSYTTGEAIASGYPVIVFDLGAPAERVRRENAGDIVSEISVEAMWKIILKKLNLKEG